MANKKISQLTAATTPLTGTETLPIVQGGNTVKATAQAIANISNILPVVNTYPTTTPGSAGTRFLYKGNEWHYMTAAEIASAGWTGLVSVGFPAPVVKAYDLGIFTDFTGDISISPFGDSAFTFPVAAAFTTVDTLGFGNPIQVRTITLYGSGQASLIRNAQLLKNVEDIGTQFGINIQGNKFSATALNNFFTDLPSTSVVCTINVIGNPGAATCNPLIATAKGYTVVTA